MLKVDWLVTLLLLVIEENLNLKKRYNFHPTDYGEYGDSLLYGFQYEYSNILVYDYYFFMLVSGCFPERLIILILIFFTGPYGICKHHT